jgi:hypothetical protein
VTGPDRPAPPPREDPYPAEKARGGRIVLDTPLQRAIFFGGLFGLVLLCVLSVLFGMAR